MKNCIQHLAVGFGLIHFATVYAQDGSLDLTFGGTGIVTTDIAGEDDLGSAIALQADGKIVVVGKVIVGSDGDFGITRYNADGSLDMTFSTDGKETTDFGGYEGANSVAIQSDGKIVVTGYRNMSPDVDIVVARYNSDGSLDTGFDLDGKVITDVTDNESGNSVNIQSDGKIVVAGRIVGDGDDFLVVRYSTDGSLDLTFDTDGIVTTNVGGSSNIVYASVIQDDNKIVVAGSSGSNDFALARYNTDGTLDVTFDSDGIVSTFLGGINHPRAITLQADGKIIVAGECGSNYPNNDFVLVRYNADGSLDNSFSADGKVITDIAGFYDMALGVSVQSDGKIVAAGWGANATNNDFALVRYLADGTPDVTFGGDGIVTTDMGNVGNMAYAITIQTDGKILAAGSGTNGTDYDFALARYHVGIAGVDENTTHADFSVYPNPAKGQLVIATPVWVENGAVSLLTVNGQVLKRELNLSGPTFIMDISEQASGIYFVEFVSETEQSVIKLIIE